MTLRGTESDILPLFPTFVWKLQWAQDRVAQLKHNILVCTSSANERWRTLPPGTFWQSEPNQPAHRP